MGAKKKTKEPEKFGSRQFSGLASQIGIQGLLEFLKRHLADKKPMIRNAGTIRMCCPIHGDHTPSFDIEIADSYCHCYGCSYSTRNLLTFCADALRWTYNETVNALQQYAAGPLFNDKVNARLEEQENYEIGERAVLDCCNAHLQRCLLDWRNGITPGDPDYTREHLELVEPTLRWLIDTRHHEPDTIGQFPIGILPPYHMLGKFTAAWLDKYNDDRSVLGRPLLPKERLLVIQKGIEERYSNIDPSWINCVTFHCGVSFTVPGRTRIRRPGSKEFYVVPGLTPDAPVGCFCLWRAHTVLRSQDAGEIVIIAVEGENDAMSINECLLRHGISNFWAISIGGHTNSLDMLHEAGIKRIYLVGDEPLQGKGHEFVRSRLVTATLLDIRVFNHWSELCQGREETVKDPDDVIHVLGFEWFKQVVIDRYRQNFVTTEVWALGEVLRAVANLDEPDNAREKTGVAAAYGKAVRHPAAQSEYLRLVSEALAIDAGPIRLEILKNRDTEGAFLLRIMEQFKTDFHIPYRTIERGHSYIHFWHKRLRKPLVLPMDDGEGASIQLSSVYGEIVEFFHKTVGLPPYLGYDPDAEDVLTPVLLLKNNLCIYLKAALQGLYQGLPSLSECTILGQGYHFLADPFDVLAEPGHARMVIYIVNGTHVYKGIQEGDRIDWSELPGPSDGYLVFDVGYDLPAQPWSSELRSVEDLQGYRGDVSQAVDKLEGWIDRYWRFRNQPLDARFIAYHLFSCGASAAFPSQTITHITGDTHAGKTSLLSFYGGNASPRNRLLESSLVVENFSTASIYQRFNHTRRPMVVDEMEGGGQGGMPTQKAVAVQNFTEMLREMIKEGGTDVNRGGKDGKPVIYHLQSDVIMAAIDQAQKSQDANRRFEINLCRVNGLRDPLAAMRAEVPDDELIQVRRAITLGMPQLFPRLLEIYQRIETEMQRDPALSHVPTRYLKNFLHVCSVMEVCGRDWRAFVRESCEVRKEKIAVLAAESSSQEVYERLFFSAAVMLPGGKGVRVSLNALLANQDMWSDINQMGSGFYFLPDQKLGIVHWITAQTSILQGWREYTDIHHRALKDRFDRHPKALRHEDYDTQGVWPQIQRLIPGVRKQDISVIDLREFVDEVRGRGGAAPSAAQPPTASSFTPSAQSQAAIGAGTTPAVQGETQRADDIIP